MESNPEIYFSSSGKVFSHRYKLKQHVSNIHNKTYKHGENILSLKKYQGLNWVWFPPSVCPFCQKAFNLRHQLNKHLLTHSDLKPFKVRLAEKKLWLLRPRYELCPTFAVQVLWLQELSQVSSTETCPESSPRRGHRRWYGTPWGNCKDFRVCAQHVRTITKLLNTHAYNKER